MHLQSPASIRLELGEQICYKGIANAMQGAVARVIHRYLSIQMYSQLHRAALRFGQASIRHSRQLSVDQQFMVHL
jgi:hypothetical protein